jgi:hypothetical protein
VDQFDLRARVHDAFFYGPIFVPVIKLAREPVLYELNQRPGSRRCLSGAGSRPSKRENNAPKVVRHLLHCSI